MFVSTFYNLKKNFKSASGNTLLSSPLLHQRRRLLQWAPFILVFIVSPLLSFRLILLVFFLWPPPLLLSASPWIPPSSRHPWQPATGGGCPTLPRWPAAGQGVLEVAEPWWVDSLLTYRLHLMNQNTQTFVHHLCIVCQSLSLLFLPHRQTETPWSICFAVASTYLHC